MSSTSVYKYKNFVSLFQFQKKFKLREYELIAEFIRKNNEMYPM